MGTFWRTALLFVTCGLAAAADLPTIVVTNDDMKITQSCLIEIPRGFIVSDRNSNGVIQIAADDIRVRFAGDSVLRGAPEGALWDGLSGIGIRIDGRKNVAIENARVHGFKNGLIASRADGLVVSDGDFSDNYRQHLKSTRAAESNDDWLYPHNNDTTKWRDQYGGAVCVEDSNGITLRRLKVRRGQNGILLDRVNDSFIYDNDCSYLSGWGVALWRSSRNKIQRNAFDFCIRGHVEDVYNRGQDSAGILCFEQSSENLFAENSATHGGDGFFGFAGHEAIGEHWWKTNLPAKRNAIAPEFATLMSSKGCNGNILIGNDFSYASAHGIEMTFSEQNVIAKNRIVENGITGFWGGYDSDSVIVENDFARNGGMAYGLERGAINMEHAAHNLILNNHIENNRCGIHLWWDNDGDLMKFPGVAGNERGVINNVIARNTFVIDGDFSLKRMRLNERAPILHMRDSSKTHLKGNLYVKNKVKLSHPVGIEFAFDEGVNIDRAGEIPKYSIPKYEPLGAKRAVGARREVRGRIYIVMDEWGPKAYD
jgi:parallel beta-helix repeat protein